MIAFWVAMAFAACDPVEHLANLRQGDHDAYMCFMRAEAGRDVLLSEIAGAPAGSGTERLTRALALWLLERTDREMDAALVAKLAPADRRLLADGIRARRGRASPAPEHAKVFAQLGWYVPVRTYTDGLLRAIDRANLEVVDPRTRPKPPPAAAELRAPAGEEPVTAQTPNLCGCGATGAPLGLALLAGLLPLLRRRATPRASAHASAAPGARRPAPSRSSRAPGVGDPAPT